MKDTLYVVHTMGRCGSMSVSSGLHSAGLFNFHVHRLRGKDADKDTAGMIHNAMEDNTPIQVITLIREPVGRNISAYFLNLVDRGLGNASVEDFLKRYPHDVPLNWIPEQLTFWDCDFLKPIKRPGEFEDFYYPPAALLQSKTPVLFIRTMDLSTVWDRAWALVSDKEVELKRINSSSNVPGFQKIYHEFIRDAKLPMSYLDRMYKSEYTKTFFSSQEIDRLYQIWS